MRAAVLIHEQLAGRQAPATCRLYLPEYSWNNIQQLRRQIDLARQRGWHRAAARLTEDLADSAGRLPPRTGKRPPRPAILPG